MNTQPTKEKTLSKLEIKLLEHIHAYRMNGYKGKFELRIHPEIVYELTKSVYFYYTPTPKNLFMHWRGCNIVEDVNVPIGLYELHLIK